MKYDLCSRVPDESACDGWKQRQREIESTWRYAPGGDRARLQQEFARVTKILNDTTCGTGGQEREPLQERLQPRTLRRASRSNKTRQGKAVRPPLPHPHSVHAPHPNKNQ